MAPPSRQAADFQNLKQLNKIFLACLSWLYGGKSFGSSTILVNKDWAGQHFFIPVLYQL